jgi:predicted metal-binding protein
MNKMQKDEEKLLGDLEKYRRIALDMGADDVRIVPASDIVQKLRARLVDIWPRCVVNGSSYFRDMVEEIPWEDAKAILNSYRYGIVAHIPYPADNPNDFTGPSSVGELVTDIAMYKKFWTEEQVKYWEGVQARRKGGKPAIQGKISSIIMQEARKDGHYFAFAGTSGTCTPMCEKWGEICIAMKTGICRMASKNSPCGTAAIMGLDHPEIYEKMGWKNWVQGWSVFPEDFPGGRNPTDPPPARTSVIFID